MTGSRSPMLYAFLAVPVLYLFAFVAFPVAYNILMSLQEVTLGNITTLRRPWLGLDNYREVIAHPSFRAAAVNSLVFLGANVVAQLGLGLMVALFFSQRFPGVHFLRGLLLAAWMLPALVVGALWKWLFAPQYGVVNFVLTVLGFVREPVHWLADPSLSLLSVTIANVWFGMPFSMILISAALTGIPLEPYEAAQLDGAGPVQRFRYITLPALAPALFAIGCLTTIYTMRAFDLILAMTGGGPLDSSNVLPLFSWQFTFQQFRFGIGATIGTFAFLIVFAVALAYIRTLNREPEA